MLSLHIRMRVAVTWLLLLLIGTLFCPNPSLLAQDLSNTDQPFQHGVASGDPLTDRVIIWTRVTPRSEDSIEVEWRVSTDPSLTDVVRSGIFTTGAHRDYTVKVDVDGLLPGVTYYYGFTALGKTSLVGKTKTAPSAMADQVKFAVVSCSNLQHGYFNSYGRIADRTDLDAVIHLGDYIYEYSATGDDFYGAASLRDNGERLHAPDKEIITIEDYRTRYAQYRMDPDLMRAHQQHPFILIWDDHESANDAYEDGAENHQEDEGDWTDRKAIAKQVYDEWMPIRSDLNEFPLYRTISYGSLLDLIMLDTRLEGRDEQIGNAADPALYSTERTILGPVQKDWFFDQLASSDATWKVVGNQVIFSEFNVWWAANPADPVLNSPLVLESVFLDIWDGYPSEREEIIDFIAGVESEAPIDNVVILTGDFHSTFGFDVSKRPAPLSGSDPAIAVVLDAPVPVQPTYNPETGAGSVAVEFATPSVTSANFDENLPPPVAALFQFQINNPLPEDSGPVAGINPNPHMKYTDLNRHGYFILDITPDHAQADWYFTEDIFTRNEEEVFGEAWFTATDENRLQQSEGPSAPKPEQDEAAPVAPKPVTPVLRGQLDPNAGGVLLEWSDGVAEDSYVLERAGEDGGFSEIAVLDADVTSFLDEAVDDVEAFRYQVKAVNAAFESEYSNVFSVGGQAGASFFLIDASTDTAIRSLGEGDVIDLRSYLNPLSIEVRFTDEEPYSVTYSLNGDIVQTEFIAPYSLGGDQAGDFAGVSSLGTAGFYYLEAIAGDESGNALETAVLPFQVINSDLYVADFVLVDAVSNEDLFTFSKGKATLNLADFSTRQFSIRAVPSIEDVGSMLFETASGLEQVENVAPYALGGDVGGNYSPVQELVEDNMITLTATPYTSAQALGNPGTPLTLMLTVEGAFAEGSKVLDRDIRLESVPEKTTLAGNYPNPFNPTTAIQFGLSEPSHARIVIYDVLGRIVDVVVDEVLNSGWHTAQIDGSGLASGIYIYQLETPDTVLIGQMILQK